MIKESLQATYDNISEACRRSGRNPDSVQLIAVSKFKSVDDIMEAYNAGQRVFGENHVKEMLQKEEILPDDIQWHMIGHLQTNKVRSVIGKTCLIHGIDSIHLADVIDSESRKQGIISEGLLEINMGGEESKWGFPGEIDKIDLEHISAYKNLRIRGLMTVAPYVDDPEKNRTIFRKIKALSVDIESKNYDNISMEMLSMGMTADYVVAVEEGATHVRVGTGIFGARDYSV